MLQGTGHTRVAQLHIYIYIYSNDLSNVAVVQYDQSRGAPTDLVGNFEAQ